MNKINPPSPIRAIDYEAIETALMESARGRWFLAEFAKRNRSSDTNILLGAITKLETAVMGERTPGAGAGTETIRRDLIEMSEAIARTRREIASIRPANSDAAEGRGLISATEELDAIVESTETATSDILGAAEEIQETAWLLREKGVDEESCDRLDQRATDIYTACSFQDITGQRTNKVVQILRYLEARVNAMVDIWGLDEIFVRDEATNDSRPDAHLLNGPQLKGRGLEQIAVDDMIENQDLFDDVEAIDVQDFDDADSVGVADFKEVEAVDLDDFDGSAGSTAPPMPRPDHTVARQAPGLTGEEASKGVVDARRFESPEPLEMDNLGPTKSEAMFG